MRILLVEDSRTSVLMVQSLLEDDKDETYELSVAGTVAEAREQLQTHEFDLILLDLTLPDSSGLATVDSIFEVSGGTGIVVLTATSDEQVGLDALKHGAQDFLIKDETYRKVLLRAVKYARQRAVAERELKEAQELAEFATQSKSSFIANLSHELRSPLNSILGFSEMMLENMNGELSDKHREYAKDIHASGRYLLGLIGTVLDMSKIEANRIEIHDDPVDPQSLLQEVIGSLHLPKEGDFERIAVHLPEQLPHIRGDRIKLKQVLINLIDNAVKYSPKGGVVDVEAEWLQDTGFIVRIKDRGIGIDQTQIASVFEPFERSSGSREHAIAGTGLGLPLTKGLVEAHGGTLTLESQVNVGTTATVTLPSSRVIA